MWYQTESNPSAIVQFISGFQAQIVINEKTQNNSLSPMEAVKQYMLDEIKSIRDTRYMLKNKYPELFSLYVI